MKKLVSSILFIVFAGSMTLMAANTQNSMLFPEKKAKSKVTFSVDSDDIEFVSVKDITKDILKKIFEGKLPNTAISCEKGDEVPFALSVDGQVISKAEATSLLNDLGPVSLRNVDGELLVSEDGEEWRPLSDSFEMDTNLNVTFSKNIPKVNLGLSIKPKGQEQEQ